MNEVQMNEINATISRRKSFLINLGYFGVIGIVVVLVIRYALASLMPFLIAAVAAAILRPVLRLLNQRWKIPRKLAGVSITVLFFLLIASLGIVLFDRAFDAVMSFVRALPGLWSDTLMPALKVVGYDLAEKLAQMNVDISFSVDELLAPLGTSITSLSTKLVGMAGNFAFSLPSALISVIICIVSTLFMLFDWDKMVGFVELQIPDSKRDLVRKVVRQSNATIRQFIVSYGLILLITFSELSVGFTIIGFKNAFLLAALISVFDILPVVGCGGVLIPWMLISFIIGNNWAGIGLGLLYIVITIVRNIIEPKIVGKQVGLHPLVTLMSMVIGSSLMGGVGLFGLPITLAVINKMNKDGVLHLYRTGSERQDSPKKEKTARKAS